MLARTVASPPPRDFPGQRSSTGTTSRRLLLAGALVLNLVVLYAPPNDITVEVFINDKSNPGNFVGPHDTIVGAQPYSTLAAGRLR